MNNEKLFFYLYKLSVIQTPDLVEYSSRIEYCTLFTDMCEPDPQFRFKIF